MRTLGVGSPPLDPPCVGAAIDVCAARQWVGPVAISSTLSAMPLATLATATVFWLESLAISRAGIAAAQIVVALAALPLDLIDHRIAA